MDKLPDKEIIHGECGLNLELCVCPDAPYYWDDEKGAIVERTTKNGENSI